MKDKNIQKRTSSYKYKILHGIWKTWNFCNTVESLPAVGLRVRNQLVDERPRFAVYCSPGVFDELVTVESVLTVQQIVDQN